VIDTSRPRTPAVLARLTGTTAIVVAVIGWLEFASGQPLSAVVRAVPVGLLLSVNIGAALWLVARPVRRRLAGRHPAAVWAATVVVLAAAAALGTASSSVCLWLMGMWPAASAAFMANVRGTIPVTVIVGISMIARDRARARADAAERLLEAHQLERERAERLAAEAQLAALAARVQPHFLFNTLNSISGLIAESPDHAEALIERLASWLRSSLEPRDSVPIATELQLVTDYLEIQRARHGNRLRYRVSIAPETSGDVPPFALQTLVENSVTHGGRRRREGVEVHIAARCELSTLVVEVADDGPGFDPIEMKAGHGLDLVQRRLQARWGGAAVVELQRQPRGMVVRLRVPTA